jgi:hypothetical protein
MDYYQYRPATPGKIQNSKTVVEIAASAKL